MQRRIAVLSRYPEAAVVEDPMAHSPGPWGQRGRWYVYAGAEPDARLLGHGATERQAWARAARRVSRMVKPKVKWRIAG
jgi:hypothetical protein